MIRSAPIHPKRREEGFTLLEILIAGSVLAIALLGHTASLFSEQRLSTAQRTRSSVLLASEQLMERLRSDDDWSGLYARLRTLSVEAKEGNGPVKLVDGRTVFPVTHYFDDYAVPPGLEGLQVLVDVPAVNEAGVSTGTPALVLREDASLPGFGLPADLNGDGIIDDDTRDDDYVVLPVIVTLRWQATGAPAEELRIASWLWGQR